MSGSDHDLIKEVEEDVVETQGTVRYKSPAHKREQDEADFDDYYEDDAADLIANAEKQAGGATSDIVEDYWDEEEVVETEDGVRVTRHKLAPRTRKTEEEGGQTKQAGGAIKHKSSRAGEDKPRTNLVVKLLEKNPLGMTLPEMAGGVRKQKRIKTLRPMLAQAIREGLIMPVSQRAGHTVYKLVKHIGSR